LGSNGDSLGRGITALLVLFGAQLLAGGYLSTFPGEVNSGVSSGTAAARLIRHFYLALAIFIALIVAVAFAKKAVSDLAHPFSPLPWVLHFHVALSGTWILLFVAQATLIDRNRLAWHRKLGAFGAVIGALLPIAGIATAIATARYHIAQGAPVRPAGIILPISDMLAFAIIFGLAIWLRARPEYHRRLMLMAACVLCGAAFAALPGWTAPANIKYSADLLILAGAARDWVAMRRIHRVFVFGLAFLIAWQLTARWIYVSAEPTWVAIANHLVQ
jgi:hypothetical protein